MHLNDTYYAIHQRKNGINKNFTSLVDWKTLSGNLTGWGAGGKWSGEGKVVTIYTVCRINALSTFIMTVNN